MKYFLRLLLIFIPFSMVGQTMEISPEEMLAQRGEIYFQFQLHDDASIEEEIMLLNKTISIDQVKELTVWAYANEKEYNSFKQMGYEMEMLIPPSMQHRPKMLHSFDNRAANDWDYYPDYDTYMSMMNQYAIDYPNLCELITIGTLNSGREIVAIHINTDLSADNDKPQFFYTSSMHGDELAGYILTLRLIDYLLTNYGSDERVDNLVDNIDIWLNPLANPDGTFAGGNHTVYGATRGNANGIDFNRNFPDPEDGTNPDGNPHQEETILFMDFAEAHDFVMSANMHGGAEVCNYPWDTWPRLAADDDWWYYVCREYADTVHAYGPQGYMTDHDDGITNGYAWYSISGGRQDYMNYFEHTREFTLELSEIKLPPASLLPQFWESNHRSLLNYMEQVLYGFSGQITNAYTGAPVQAKVYIEDHEEDNSWVFSSMPLGLYYRPVKEGTYDVTYSAFGYYSKTVSGIQVQDRASLTVDVELTPYMSLTAGFSTDETLIGNGQAISFYDESLGGNIESWSWEFEGADPQFSTEENPVGIYYGENGSYDVSLLVTDTNGNSNTLHREDYIKVVDQYLMTDTTLSSCEGLLYDAGGAFDNYSNNEDYQLTIYPFEVHSSVKIIFEMFDVEASTDCTNDYLNIYNGIDTQAPFLGSWCGSTGPDSITATNGMGALTLEFHSNEAVTGSGWRALITCDTGVGGIENKEHQVVLYPHPANDHLNISAKEQIQMLEVFDLSGKLHMSYQPQSNVMRLDIQHLDAGLYIIKFSLSQTEEIHKLIKL